MSLAMINGATVTKFVEDGKAFESCVNESFEILDVDRDGAVSSREFRDGFCKVVALGCEFQPKEEIDNLYNTIFERFDEDRNGVFDRREFTSLMKEIMSAMARGIGNSPVLVVAEVGSLLMRAAEHEFGQKCRAK